MSLSSSARVPKYALHKASGQAVVRLGGLDFYLGKFGSDESRNQYDRLIGEWMLQGRQAPLLTKSNPGSLTVNELIIAYATFADAYYRKNGVPTGEYDAIRYSLRPLRRLYGDLNVAEFGPLALKNVREEMLKADLCRNEINKRVGRIIRLFKWGVENEYVTPMTHHALSQVRGLSRGRTKARESEAVRPVSDSHVEAVQPFVSRQVWTMIRLQKLTGMRPGEVCLMRAQDIDQTASTWIYRPGSHKTEHHGHERKVYLGPKAQGVLREWLRKEPAAYMFSPKDELAERSAARRTSRKSKIQPSQQRRRRKTNPKRAPRDRYFSASYNRAIARACLKAGIPAWHANQLRHSAATIIRRDFGLEAASVILGHRGVGVTQVYAERDEIKAVSVVHQIG